MSELLHKETHMRQQQTSLLGRALHARLACAQPSTDQRGRKCRAFKISHRQNKYDEGTAHRVRPYADILPLTSLPPA